MHPLRIAPPSPDSALEYQPVDESQLNICMEFKTLINENSLAANLAFVNKPLCRNLHFSSMNGVSLFTDKAGQSTVRTRAGGKRPLHFPVPLSSRGRGTKPTAQRVLWTRSQGKRNRFFLLFGHFPSLAQPLVQAGEVLQLGMGQEQGSHIMIHIRGCFRELEVGHLHGHIDHIPADMVV